MIATQKLISVLGRIENIVEKGENAGFQHFLLFSQCFQKLSVSRGVKSRDCVVIGLNQSAPHHIQLTSIMTFFNPLPDDKILDWSKSKQIADDIL